MFEKLKSLFSKKAGAAFRDEEYARFMELKTAGLENVLGKMYDRVHHAAIPFTAGGAVDMYFFPSALPGTGFATMELIQPDGTGPKATRVGIYELVAFTRYKIGDPAQEEQFSKIELRFWRIFTMLGNYGKAYILNPFDTIEIPAEDQHPASCLILTELKPDGKEFRIGRHKYALLLVIEVFRSEMEFAMQNGTQNLLVRLQEKGHYPYSDLDRDPVAR